MSTSSPQRISARQNTNITQRGTSRNTVRQSTPQTPVRALPPRKQRTRARNRRLRQNKRGKGGAARNVQGARGRLQQFRQASLLAVIITTLLLTVIGGDDAAIAQTTSDTGRATPDTVAIIDEVPTDSLIQASNDPLEDEDDEILDTRAATDQAIGTLTGMWRSFIASLPKFGIAIVIFFLAWGAVKLIKPLMRTIIGKWEKSNAIIALSGILIWVFAIVVVMSILAGDIRALVGSLGLIGLALSWALQTPIESFTGWLLNSFQGYYRVGDRVSVGEVTGDVYRIDFLTTTVWEIGGPYRSGFIQAEQATGRLVTFPNSEVLSGTIINFTRDFNYVWDELAVQVANESDLNYAMTIISKIANELLGEYMAEPTRYYEQILRKAGLESSIPNRPEVFVSMTDSWTDVSIRYLVGARERRKWKSELVNRITIELNKAEHAGKIVTAYPRQQVQFINTKGNPEDPTSISSANKP
jgi:small-conductance mechanosensitive channel